MGVVITHLRVWFFDPFNDSCHLLSRVPCLQLLYSRPLLVVLSYTVLSAGVHMCGYLVATLSVTRTRSVVLFPYPLARLINLNLVIQISRGTTTFGASESHRADHLEPQRHGTHTSD